VNKIKRFQRIKKVRGVGGCPACTDQFTVGRPPESCATLSGTILVHHECAEQLNMCGVILTRQWKRPTIRRTFGPMPTTRGIIDRIFTRHPDIEAACDQRAEDRASRSIGCPEGTETAAAA
jgi:hypothetical protein